MANDDEHLAKVREVVLADLIAVEIRSLKFALRELYEAGRISMDAMDAMRVALYQLRAELQSRGITVPLEDDDDA